MVPGQIGLSAGRIAAVAVRHFGIAEIGLAKM